MIVLLSLAMAATNPTLEVSWNRDEGSIRIAAPQGEHVAPDSTVWMELHYGGRTLTTEYPSDMGNAPLLAMGLRGQPISGSFRAPICKDDGTECRMLTVNVAGVVPDVKKGSLLLDMATPEAPVTVQVSPFHRDASEDVAVAMAAATTTGRTVLLDFSAVWCPPCNLLAAEVLHAPDAEGALSEVLIVVVDVDDPSSWELKDRYDVGGYPTVVAVLGDGTEIDRMLGYDNREATLSWIADVSDGQASSRVPGQAPADVTPLVAAQTALSLLERGDDGYEAWLERANTEPELVETRMARVYADATAEDAQWLLDNAPDTSEQWVLAAMALGEDHPALLKQAAGHALSTVPSAVEKADYMYVMADLSESPEREALFSGAAATLRTGFVGEPVRDRAHVTFLATLLAKSGDLDAAMDVLAEFEEHFPDEPTWDMKAASLFLDEDQLQDALTRSDQAVAHAWGDNALRAAKTRATILVELGRMDDARAYVADVLASQPVPEEGANIRTPRYRQQLADVVAEDGE